jgi:hypothetical protein
MAADFASTMVMGMWLMQQEYQKQQHRQQQQQVMTRPGV